MVFILMEILTDILRLSYIGFLHKSRSQHVRPWMYDVGLAPGRFGGIGSVITIADEDSQPEDPVQSRPLWNVMLVCKFWKALAEAIQDCHPLCLSSEATSKLAERLMTHPEIANRVHSLSLSPNPTWSNVKKIMALTPELRALDVSVSEKCASSVLPFLVEYSHSTITSLSYLSVFFAGDEARDLTQAFSNIGQLVSLTTLRVYHDVRAALSPDCPPLVLPNVKTLSWAWTDDMFRPVFSNWLIRGQFHDQCSFYLLLPGAVNLQAIDQLFLRHHAPVIFLQSLTINKTMGYPELLQRATSVVLEEFKLPTLSVFETATLPRDLSVILKEVDEPEAAKVCTIIEGLCVREDVQPFSLSLYYKTDQGTLALLRDKIEECTAQLEQAGVTVQLRSAHQFPAPQLDAWVHE